MRAHTYAHTHTHTQNLYHCGRTWLSAYVEKTWDFLTGIVVPRLMRVVMTPPAVSIPSDSGATSNRRTSFVASAASPLKIPPCTAAPYAWNTMKIHQRETSNKCQLITAQFETNRRRSIITTITILKLQKVKVMTVRIKRRMVVFPGNYSGLPSSRQ